MSKTAKPILITLSVFALLNVIFMPIFDVWGGLFPSDVDRNFFEVIEIVFEDSDAWSLWVVQLTMSIFIPSAFMFIMSIAGNRGLFITSNVIGIVLWFKQIIDYGMEDDGFDDLFDFEDGNISIGTWIAIGIFLISFFVAVSSKRKVDNYVNPLSVATNNSSVPLFENKVCPMCGMTNEANVKFCAGCGNEINDGIKQTVGENSYSEQTFENESNTISFCPNCGTQIENKISFCGKCGHKL